MSKRIVLLLSLTSCIICSTSGIESILNRKNVSIQRENRDEIIDNEFIDEENDSENPLKLIMLPESYSTQRCLDGSPFGYYLRRSTQGKNKNNFVFHLQGGGLCVKPKSCQNRKNNEHGSSKYWPDTFTPGRGSLQDVMSDDPEINPYFYDFNHVYLRYCSGDTWTGGRTSFDRNDLWFSGHRNLEAAIDHMNKTQQLGLATHVFLLGTSAGGIGVFNNADFFREKWLNQSTIFKAAPVAGFYFPGDVFIYPEWQHNIHIPINSIAAKYLTTWYGSILDESCVLESGHRHEHMCWDAHYLYKHIDTPIFVSENIFEKNQIESVLKCPNPWENNSTKSFMEWFGDTMVEGLISTVGSERGLLKGDGMFVPGCLEHGNNFCLQNGSIVNGKKMADLLPMWYFEEDPIVASTFQEIDSCNKNSETHLPCNYYCKC